MERHRVARVASQRDATTGKIATAPAGERVVCDNPPRKIPYYRLNQSTLVIKR
jgi:hypothetical protein